MGDLIQFPIKPKEPDRPVLDERLARIRAKLAEINQLMEKLRHDSTGERNSFRPRQPPEHTD